MLEVSAAKEEASAAAQAAMAAEEQQVCSELGVWSCVRCCSEAEL